MNIWPEEVKRMFANERRAISLTEISAEKLKKHINTLWLQGESESTIAYETSVLASVMEVQPCED